MSHRNDSSRKHRKSRSIKNDQHYPTVSFDGAESVDIPADEGKSPVSTHLSLASNPTEFKFMDEIALLKRGRIDKDAPKHPYNRRGQQPMMKKEISVTSAHSNSSLPVRSPAIMTLMGGVPEAEKEYNVGKGGLLKISKMKEGGKRYEVSANERFTVFQQTAGQTCLFTFKA
ncbi:uncharacterized protein CELE_ZK512.8 [Caenorhabditis elegans]|uniref:Uncharacterized protein ZK512.8 n=1 Tax=Caenorhabditis elegans TaxID=6239 RepID=YOQ8_CAEEL|nr:Uncharacterized protein CELE_ZK512.8 [Caenorhabditis elegans]P34646.1 RecName: Full=Uncharacterized protein ZK512.8 [Caenorhabditis elegans]CAA80149.1 Uncharacterized protein CELE_ZK512.8 [Caenorhabditis elegans]|eukprot:NP_499027.1 Uncharacterized protein CELE_ZK512.8 [Caenorhabditis elegans]